MPVLPSYRNQSIGLHSKSIGWFLYEGNTGTLWVKCASIVFEPIHLVIFLLTDLTFSETTFRFSVYLSVICLYISLSVYLLSISLSAWLFSSQSSCVSNVLLICLSVIHMHFDCLKSSNKNVKKTGFFSYDNKWLRYCKVWNKRSSWW